MAEKEEDLDKKPVKVKDAEITEDGCLVITFNTKTKAFAHTKKALFMPEALLALVETYGYIPPADDDENDFPGVPVVEEEEIFSEDGEDDKADGGSDEPTDEELEG